MRPRVVITVLLVWAAYWAAVPWIDCMRNFLPFGLGNVVGLGLGVCTFGLTSTGPVSTSGSFVNLAVAALYVAAAIWVVRRSRSF